MRWNGLIEAVLGRRSGDYFTRALYGRIWRLLEEEFHPQGMHERIDRLAAATDTLAAADLERWPRWGEAPQNPQYHRDELRRYVSERWAFLRAFLESEQPTSARETGPWPGPPPRTASGLVPPRATAYRTFRYEPAARVVLSEIHYHPEGDEELEFFELANLEEREVDVSGWSVPAVGFTFPPGTTVGAGARAVVARRPDALRAAHPMLAEGSVFGPWPRRLANDGETLRLVDAGTHGGRRDHPETIDVVRYSDEGAWPTEADGGGRSLELVDLALDNDRPESWRASAAPGGSPGR
jgi:hypothetical protein